MNRMFILLIICLVFISKSVFAQQTVIEKYVGIWRWTSGKGDTLIILLRKCKRGISTLQSAPDSVYTNLLVGFHTYIENGQLVESNMNLVSDTLSIYQSISGKIVQDEMKTLFFDSLRDREFKGTFRLLSDLPNKAILYLPYEGERIIWEKKKIYPNGRTIPDNIVLEKID